MAITDAPKIITGRFSDPESHTLARYVATGGYAALRAYEAELLRVHDTLAETERNYRTTDEATAALFEGRT